MFRAFRHITASYERVASVHLCVPLANCKQCWLPNSRSTLSGDLFVDGKVIHRPQYWYNERQPTRRPRPRYDRRRETMHVERRDPGNRVSWAQSRPQAVQQQMTMESQGSAQVGGAGVNMGESNTGRT